MVLVPEKFMPFNLNFPRFLSIDYSDKLGAILQAPFAFKLAVIIII
jgi:hypothetical protein